MPPRFFGSEPQKAMQQTAHRLWKLLGGDAIYGTEGRMVAIDGPEPQDVDSVEALARLQGATVNHYVPKAREAEFASLYAARGLANDRWDQFMGGSRCLELCARLIEDFRLPDRYSLHRVTAETPDTMLDRLEDTALSCGVLPPMSPVLAGQMRPAGYFYLQAPDGGVAACAGAVMRNLPGSRFGKASWWGMLATRDADRGQGLSLYLGARAALYMHEQFGVEEFYTGVRTDNAVSRHVCEKLGVTDSDYACLAVLDPAAFGDGGYTK